MNKFQVRKATFGMWRESDKIFSLSSWRKDIQEEPQSQTTAYQRHQEEEQTNRDK